MIEAGKNYGGSPYTPILLTVNDNVTEVVFCPFCRDMILQITTVGIGIVGSYTFTVEGSNDGSNFGNLSATNATTTISTNITTIITYDGALPPYVRVSISPSAFVATASSYSIYVSFGVLS